MTAEEAPLDEAEREGAEPDEDAASLPEYTIPALPMFPEPVLPAAADRRLMESAS